MNTRAKQMIGAIGEGVSWFLETLCTGLVVGAGFAWGAVTALDIYLGVFG